MQLFEDEVENEDGGTSWGKGVFTLKDDKDIRKIISIQCQE